MFLDAVLVYNFLLDEPHERIRAVAVIRIMEFDELYVVDDFFIGGKLPANSLIVPINSSIIVILFSYY